MNPDNDSRPRESGLRNPGRGTVVLCNPAGYKFIGDRTLPMGLLSLASALMDKYNVIIVDQRAQRNWKSRLKRALSLKPVCVGVTTMTGKQVQDAVRISGLVKRMSPGVPVVWGGIHASLLPEQTLRHRNIDAVVIGEGEESLRELADALASGKDPEGIPGVALMRNGECRIGPQREFIDLKKLPATPYHLVNIESYVERGKYGRTIRLFSSRGCPQRCAFCYNLCFNRRTWRAFEPGRVIQEVKFFTEHYNINHVLFMDDNFFVDLDRAREIAKGIRFLPGPVTWAVLGAHCSDLGRMDDKYLAELETSRLKEVVIGVESGSERIIKIIRKNVKVEKLLEMNRQLARHSIIPTYSFMSGFPQETDDDLRATIELAFRLKDENSLSGFGTFKPFIPYPGTELYEAALGLGFKPPSRLEEWKDFSWHNYLNLGVPWVDAEKRKRLSILYYYSVLMNPYYPFIGSGFYTWAVKLLGPGVEKRLRELDLKDLWITRVMRFIQNRMI